MKTQKLLFTALATTAVAVAGFGFPTAHAQPVGDLRIDFCTVDAQTGQTVANVPVQLEAMGPSGWYVFQSGGNSREAGCTSWFSKPGGLTYRVTSNSPAGNCPLLAGETAALTAPAFGALNLGPLPLSCAAPQPLPVPDPAGNLQLSPQAIQIAQQYFDTHEFGGGGVYSGSNGLQFLSQMREMNGIVFGGIYVCPATMLRFDNEWLAKMRDGTIKVSQKKLAEYTEAVSWESREVRAMGADAYVGC